MVGMSAAPLASRCRIEASRALRWQDIGRDEIRCVAHFAAMARQVDRLRALRELVQRGHEVAHRTIRRRDDGRGPAHDVIAGKNQVCLPQARTPCGSRYGRAWRSPRWSSRRRSPPRHRQGHGRDGNPYRCWLPCAALRRHGAGARRDAALRRSTVRAGRGLDGRNGGRMVAVGVRDEDVRHGFAAHGIEQRRDVLPDRPVPDR